MSASATLKVSFICGDTIDDCCVVARDIARRVWCYVEFDFNGISCHASPNGDPKKLASEYRRLLRLNSTMKMAFDT